YNELRRSRVSPKLGLQVGEVAVAEALDDPAGLHRAVDDAGMIELVDEYGVARAYQRGYHTQVGLESRGEDERGFLLDERREFDLELLVKIGVPVQKAATGTGGSVLPQRRLGSLDESGVVGETQVVVGADHDPSASVHHDLRAVG